MRVVLDGLVMGESVRWHDGRLWFCDWGAGQIVMLDAGLPSVVARVDDFPSCIDWLPDGRLVVITGRGPLLRQEADGSLAVFTTLTSPFLFNDIAVDGRGRIFVNNIGYDFPGGSPAPGTVSVVTPDGVAREVAGGLEFPNGMAVDGETLIVAESHAGRLTAFDIAPDGSLSGRRVWAPLGEGAAPDGIFAAGDGTVWYADVPNQQCVLVREGGQVLRTIPLDRGGFDCAVGDGVLYAATAVYPSAEPSGQLVAVDLADYRT
ncbi:SMP-30/gluconolactonase/LRE family protein [Actinoplanes friuliensis]|uniref:SMP-30/gluconolaconase/LRE-like region-containing protein n=1 Tax=Actinoplanes friuliensis DSM 7358 TaxID=1246995 RepID=U5W2U0_9ACTN|nr:SMP-30/gluconolactonase/LRE family protein [Actinoplanes friuliensis]AGZ42231.1 SMP-30/gluconolaconase/LRE-like region-containing protein [Actinoplanes friuliensis DSM 7358]